MTTRALLLAVMVTPSASAALPLFGVTLSPSDELAGELRGLLIANLPTPLHESSQNWGHTRAFSGLRPGRREKVEKNHGLWRKIKVTAIAPKDNLVLDLRDVKAEGLSKYNFTLYLAGDLEFDITQIRWVRGVRLYDASVVATARVKATLECEASVKIEPASPVPDIVFTLKVGKADVRYDNLDFKHVAGVGGDGAKVIGEAAHDVVNAWKPSLERELLEKANAAIVKAAEKKEVRLSLSKLLKPAGK